MRARQMPCIHRTPLQIIHSTTLNYDCVLVQEYCTGRRSVLFRSENAISASGGVRLLQSASLTILYYNQKNAEREIAEAEAKQLLV
jgi:hypothetical protein